MSDSELKLIIFKYKKKYLKYKSKYLESKSNKINDTNKPIKAIGYFDGDKIKGTVYFEETNIDLIDSSVKITVNLYGFEPNSVHGFHVHESGNITKGCDSMCAHFNPYNCNHGGREDEIRHVGDLGNIIADNEGNIQIEFIDRLIKLRGDKTNIIGRGLIVHENPDDCGKANNPDSLKTGNSGKRIGCAIIGYL